MLNINKVKHVSSDELRAMLSLIVLAACFCAARASGG